MSNINAEDVIKKLDKYLADVTPEQFEKDLEEAGLGFYADKDAGAKLACSDGLDSFAQALTFILNEVEANHGDSLRDITNEALIKYNISLVCGKDHKLLPFNWES